MHDEISRFIQESQKTNAETAEAVWRELFPKLMQLVKKKLGGIRQRDFDEQDIAQSAIFSYFKGLEAGRFSNIDCRDEIWRLLVTIAARKITAKRRKEMAKKRGGGKVRGESVFEPASGDDSCADGLAQIMDENQMPESAEEIAAACPELIAALSDDKLRTTALLRMECYTIKEIANRMDCSVSRIKQRITLIKKIWQQLYP